MKEMHVPPLSCSSDLEARGIVLEAKLLQDESLDSVPPSRQNYLTFCWQTLSFLESCQSQHIWQVKRGALRGIDVISRPSRYSSPGS